jgi:proteasome accessory factor A
MIPRPLFGLETEYGYSILGTERPLDQLPGAGEALFRAVKASQPCLRDGQRGVFLGNGGRFYVDIGCHPEMCTPECDDPLDVVRQAAAMDRILEQALPGAGAMFPRGLVPYLYTTNTDRGTHTWGSHESYLHDTDPSRFKAGLVPHLVTRILYTGAGGFEHGRTEVNFVISPRALRLQHLESCDSTRERGILHGRQESLARGGFQRLHLICGESLRSQLATWLRFGTTALVVHLISCGKTKEDGIQLSSPVDDMHALSRTADPRTRLSRVGAEAVTALEVQRRTCAFVQDHLSTGLLPPWAWDICSCWEKILDALERDDPVLDGMLDWRLKRCLLADHLTERGLLAESFGLCPSKTGQDAKLLPQSGMTAKAREEVREELHTLDVRFGELGGESIFSELDRCSALGHRLVTEEEILTAMKQPPLTTRAHHRGAAVRELAARKAPRPGIARWQGVHDQAGRFLDLGDPFGRGAVWREGSGTDPDLEAILEVRI